MTTPPNPLSSPGHWWHKRGPRTEAEANEFTAWKFMAHREAELVIWRRDNAPELPGPRQPWSGDLLAKYERERALAIAVGREAEIVHVRGASDEQLLAAVEQLKHGDRQAVVKADAAGRAAFTEALRAGRWPFEEWRKWGEMIDEATKVAGVAEGAARLLDLARSDAASVRSQATRGSLISEIDKATGNGLAGFIRA